MMMMVVMMMCSAFEGDQGATQYSAKSAKKGQIGSRLLTQPPPSARHTDDDDDYTMAQRKHGRTLEELDLTRPDQENVNIDKLPRWRNQRWRYRGTTLTGEIGQSF